MSRTKLLAAALGFVAAWWANTASAGDIRYNLVQTSSSPGGPLIVTGAAFVNPMQFVGVNRDSNGTNSLNGVGLDWLQLVFKNGSGTFLFAVTYSTGLVLPPSNSFTNGDPGVQWTVALSHDMQGSIGYNDLDDDDLGLFTGATFSFFSANDPAGAPCNKTGVCTFDASFQQVLQAQQVPEPSAVAVLASAAVALGVARRPRRRGT